MLLAFYRHVMSRSAWILRLVVRVRTLRGLEESAHSCERRGESTLERPIGRVLWIHAASIGEMRSVLPLARHLLARDAGLTCLITTVTLTAARLVRQMGPGRIIHQYAPFDHPAWVARFMDHWRPDAVIWVESELWPNSLEAVKARGLPLVMVNGRLSERSAKRWAMAPRTIAHVLGLFDACLAQSEADAARLRGLGARDVTIAGNMKYSGSPLPFDAAALEALKAQVGTRPCVLFASPPEGAVNMAARAVRALTARYPDILGIIMPRHPVRGDDIAQQLEKAGFSVARRSQQQPVGAHTQIYLADTLGEPGLFFRLSRVVFMGNSLISTPGGGHNPVEPAQLGCAILYGPHMWNFTEIDHDLRRMNAALRVGQEKDLAPALERLLAEPARIAAMGRAAQDFVAEQNKVLDRVAAHIAPVLARAGIAA